MKKVSGAKWRKSLKGWHIPDTTENRRKCKLPLNAASSTLHQNENAIHLTTHTKAKPIKAALLPVSDNNKEQMQKFLQHLQLKAYSSNTIRT